MQLLMVYFAAAVGIDMRRAMEPSYTQILPVRLLAVLKRFL